MLKKIRNLFFTGILVLLPLVVSIYILWYLFIIIDNWTSPVVELIFNRELPGLGIILTLLVVFLAGLFATNILGKKIIKFGESILLKIPLFRNIYISIKGVLEGMFHQQRKSFEKAILFEYPRKGLYQVGFITNDSSYYFNNLTGKILYNVFLPTTPNPTSGMLILVPKEDTYILDMSVEDAMKLIISGGILSPNVPDVGQINLRGLKNE